MRGSPESAGQIVRVSGYVLVGLRECLSQGKHQVRVCLAEGRALPNDFPVTRQQADDAGE